MSAYPHGRYALRCWETTNRALSVDASEYGDNVDELEARAWTLLRAGRFKSLVLCEWDTADKVWRKIGQATEDDLDRLA